MQSDTAVTEASGGSAESGPEWIVFECDRHRFALPVGRVREILPPLPFTRLPGAGDATCGLAGLRGRVLTVFDYGASAGLRRASAQPDFRVVILDHAGAIVGLAVERVVGAAGGDAALELRPEALRELEAPREDVLGVGELEDEPFLALDVDRVLSRLLA